VIVHGARANQPGFRHLVKWVRDKGHNVQVRVTWEEGDAERFAREAAHEADSISTVVAAGGDGTVNQVLNGLSGSSLPLGIIPLGTANDFARQVGIPDDSDHAMDVILRCAAVRIDTASVNSRRFLNVSIGGVAAEVTAETPPDAKESLGPLAYAISGIRKIGKLEPYAARFTGPKLNWRGDIVLFAVANGKQTGGGALIAPNASLTDGLLDLCIVEARSRGEMGSLLLKLRRGEHLGEPGVHYRQIENVVVSTRRAMMVNVDGESGRGSRFSYTSQAGDLKIHLPRAGN
jgi:lipid kinase YegS